MCGVGVLCIGATGGRVGGTSVRVWRAPAYLIPSPGDLPNPGIEPGSPPLQVDSLPVELGRNMEI